MLRRFAKSLFPITMFHVIVKRQLEDRTTARNCTGLSDVIEQTAEYTLSRLFMSPRKSYFRGKNRAGFCHDRPRIHRVIDNFGEQLRTTLHTRKHTMRTLTPRTLMANLSLDNETKDTRATTLRIYAAIKICPRSCKQSNI